MVFHSPNFFIFFIILLIPFFLLPRWRIVTLSLAGVGFYGASGLGMLALFLAITLIVYAVVHAMQRERLRWTFWIGLAVLIANLVFFKYTLFLLHTAEALTGLQLPSYDAFAGKLVLPIGISFYTFQLIAYLIDVRRGEQIPPKSILRFWVFISLFPQLVAGPILRGDELMPQVETIERKKVPWTEFKYGLYLFFIGLMKKSALRRPPRPLCKPIVRARLRADAGGGVAGGVCVRFSDILRLLGVQRHGARARLHAWPSAGAQLQIPLRQRESERILGSLAHYPLAMDSRLHLYWAGRQPAAAAARPVQPVRRDGHLRAVAWRDVDVRAVGRRARRAADRPQVDAQAEPLELDQADARERGVSGGGGGGFFFIL